MRREGGVGVGPPLPVADLSAADPTADGAGSRPEAPRPDGRHQVLVFAGVALAALYRLTDDGDGMLLVDLLTVGPHGPEGPDRQAPHGLPDSCVASGRSPAAEALRSGRPQWSGSDEPAASWTSSADAPSGEARGEPPGEPPQGALPLVRDGKRLGCLIVVGEPDHNDEGTHGFTAEQRGLVEFYAQEVAARLPDGGPQAGAADGDVTDGVPAPGSAGGGPAVAGSVLGTALEHLGAGSFTLTPGTGRIDADAAMLDLFDIPRGAFDGDVESLLAQTVPDDVPALMSVIEPRQAAPTGQPLEFRVRRPTGEPHWLRLSSRVAAGGARGPARVVGVVTDCSTVRLGTDEVTRVRRMAAALGDATSVREVSRVAVAALREPLGAQRLALAQLEADRLVVTVLDPPQSTAWPGVWHAAWRSEWPEAPLDALPTLRAALRGRRTSLWPEGTAFEAGLAGVGPGGLAVVPLLSRGRAVGVCLVGWDAPHPFSPEERSLLTATAGLVGQALTRARAYDREQELATTLQRSLLPRSLPELPGGVAVARYLPARRGLQVGGDWYDVIALPHNHVALVIGDVQGHSAAAATIMGQIRTAIRAYAVEGHPPDVVVSHANRLLVGMETDLFATCCYVDLGMEEGQAWCVRAGHPPPLLRHPDGDTEEVAVEGGPPLGVLAESEFPMTSVVLAPGTALALVTDGLVESAGLDMDVGLLRVRTTLAAADPANVDRMADDVLGDRGLGEDDVALLLLRYDGLKVRPIRAGWSVWRLPDAVLHARRFTARTLRSWKVAHMTDTVLLVVSELVTNALVHTEGAVHLDLMLTGDRLRVTVRDTSSRTPVKPVIVDWESTGGRGLLLVEAMSAAWGSTPVSGGKQVWCEIVVPAKESPREASPS
ncbi:SpoIIE family protein phosphatase [Streptomyces beihaiensis]|uniref:SpoIIE family protein phosphatase n=1 Tax=Streptomyces beihaiensis TaxID=2984495 RepID=A0ABT3U091_9ACTN|nr:SpoIIE family protein phosphatase [Streptomyces beihaiensis]MCX3061705.1 SpoIIE family protein phosphatase [Streptomyces beihaiensis]